MFGQENFLLPAQPAWLVQLPAIRARLAELAVPVLDRAAIEQVFCVGRRRAIELLHQFGGYLAGKTFLVDRAALLRQLEALEQGGEFAQERLRRQRVSAELARARGALLAKSVPIAAPQAEFGPEVDGLRGIELRSGELRITFQGTEELLERLFALAEAVGRDFEQFRERCEGADS